MKTTWRNIHCIVCEQSQKHILCKQCQYIQLAPFSQNGWGLRHGYALAHYNSPIGNALKLAKCQSNRRLAKVIKHAFVREGIKATTRIQPDYLVPVPSHWSRRIHRGFEITSLFSSGLSKYANIPTLYCLKNHRWRRQSSLNGIDRSWNNNRHISSTQPISGHVLLIEDVVTTGTTISQCATQLIASGARDVSVLSLCLSGRDDTSQHLQKNYDNVR